MDATDAAPLGTSEELMSSLPSWLDNLPVDPVTFLVLFVAVALVLATIWTAARLRGTSQATEVDEDPEALAEFERTRAAVAPPPRPRRRRRRRRSEVYEYF